MPAVDNSVTLQTANVSLTNAETNLFPTNAATGIAIPASGPGRVGFIGLLLVNLPNVTGITAGNSVTLNARNGTTTGGTLIGQINTEPATAGVSTGAVLVVPVPAGTQNVFIGAVLSAATGTAVGSATAPITATFLVFD